MEIVNDASPVTKHLELHCVDWNNHKMEVVNDTVLIKIITELTLLVDMKMTLMMNDYDYNSGNTLVFVIYICEHHCLDNSVLKV